MKDKVKAILIAALMIATIVAAINGIDNPKPTKLATTITKEIKEMMK
jgi:hypothetical protein